MKKFSKILSVALLVALVLSLGVANAFAADTVDITVNRDITYDATNVDSDSAGRTFKWYHVFTADHDVSSTGGGYDTDGTPGAVSAGNAAVAYTASSAVAAKLGTWVAASGNTAAHWEKASGNLWFDLAPIAGTENYSVAWINAETDADTAQAAAKWLFENEVWDGSGDLTANSDGSKWTATVAPGYYILKGSEGQNLIAATTDMTINEKNSYPTIDKEEKDEDQLNFDATHGINGGAQTASKVAVGDVIDYKVTVHVPADANMPIVVTDTMSSGLNFNNDIAVTVGGATIDATNNYVASTKGDGDTWTWKYTIQATAATKGKDVVFTFTGTVTEAALKDTGKKNDVELDYNNGHYIIPDYVEHEIYYAGINKVDPDKSDKPLEGVTFTLTETQTTGTAPEGKTLPNTVNFNVTKAKDADGKDLGYYIPGGDSNVVETDANGQICIRGLDGDKTYKLTETSTGNNTGYNLLSTPVELTLTKDEQTGDFAMSNFSQHFDRVENRQGTVLPSTGGIGTTIFYVVGGVLVLAAIILLVTKKRMSE